MPLPIGASLERPVGCRLSHTQDEQSGSVLGDPTPPQCVSHPQKNSSVILTKTWPSGCMCVICCRPSKRQARPKKRANATSDSDIKVRGPTKLNLNKCRTGFTTVQTCNTDLDWTMESRWTWTGQVAETMDMMMLELSKCEH